MNWLRVTKWKVATIFVVLIVAVLVDVFNPNVFGYDITLHKGLDIVGGSELTIAICKGPDNPVDADPPCRSGPRNGITITQAQTDTIPVLQNRVNALGVSEASVQPVGSDQISIELPGVSLAKADSILGTTALIHFAAAASGAPPTAAAKNSDYCIQNPTNGFCVDQDDLFPVSYTHLSRHAVITRSSRKSAPSSASVCPSPSPERSSRRQASWVASSIRPALSTAISPWPPSS